MKKIFKITVTAILLTALAVSAVGCGAKSVYDELKGEGYDFKLTYDAGGAFVNNTHSVTKVEVFNKNDTVTNSQGKTGIMPLDPQSPLRGDDGKFNLSKTDGTNTYFSVGWYTSREVRRDSQGNVLDYYGIPVSQSGREQGYVYGNLWNFNNDVISGDALEKGEMTLYASWIPFFSYEIYVMDENGEFKLQETLSRIDMTLPTWNERNGKQELNDMIYIAGKTFVGAYFDSEMTAPVPSVIDGDRDFVDLEKGIATQSTIKIYTVWEEGEITTIFDAEQFVDEFSVPVDHSGSYYLGADLDFSGIELPESLKEAAFSGKIAGNGFKIFNLELSNGVYAENFEQIFKTVDENAVIEDVVFDHSVNE